MSPGTRERPAWRSPAAKLAISAALLAALFAVVDVHQLARVLATADWRWITAALLLNVASQLVAGYRWFLLTHAVGFAAPLRRVECCFFSGMFLNLFGPGTVAGDLGRALFLAGGQRRTLALSTVVAHRAIGLVALIWVAALGVLSTPALPVPAALRLVAALAIPATLAAWLAGPRLVARLLPAGHRWRVLVERDLAPYWQDRRLLVVSLAWAAAVHVGQIASQMAAARALGLTLPWTYFWVLVPLLNLGTTLPVSWGGIGIREAGYWYAVSSLGDSAATGLAVGLVTSVVVLLTGLLGLPCLLLLRRAAR